MRLIILHVIIRGAGLKTMAASKMPVVIFRLGKGPDDPYAVVGKVGGSEADECIDTDHFFEASGCGKTSIFFPSGPETGRVRPTVYSGAPV